MKKLFLSIALLGTSYLAAQNHIFHYQYLNLANPAAAGIETGHSISVNLRNQWGQSSNSDNPQQQTLNTTHRLTPNIGVGLQVVNEKVFIQRQTAFFADFSYRLPLNENSNLYLGLKAGGNLFNIDASRLKTYNPSFDPYLQGVSGRFQPNIGVGAYYQLKGFYAGLSVPNLLASDKTKVKNEVVTSVSERINFYAQAGYLYPISTDFSLRPSLQAHIDQKGDYQTSVSAAVLYRDFIEGGIGYRSEHNCNIFALFKIPQYYLSVGYGFETNFDRDLRASLRNIHEFILTFHW